MRSVFMISFIVFIAVGAGGYGISWYSQAVSTKHLVEQFTEKVNAKEKYLTYDAIEISGFPSDVKVSIVKPHFKGRIDEFFNSFRKNAQLPDSNVKEWTQDTLLNGKITIGTNALSDRYSIDISGNWTQSGVINGQTFASTTESLSDSTCALQLQRETGLFDALWNFQSLNRDGMTLLKDFRVLDCNSAGGKSLDATSKEILSSSGPLRLYVTNTPQQGTTQIRFYAKITDVEITPLGDTQILNIADMLSPDSKSPIGFSAYGKQNIDIDFTYSGPTDLQTAGKNPAMDVALIKFDINNQMYTYHTNFHFNNIPAGGNRSTTLVYKTEAAVTEPYDALMQKVTHNAIQGLYSSNDPKFRELQARVQKYTPDELFGIVQPVIPNLHSLGKMVVALDSSFKGSEDFKKGDFALNTVEISATPYGIVGNGAVSMQTMPPTANAHVSCSNCLQMIDDIVAYAGKAQKLVSYFDTAKAESMAIDPAQVSAMKQFLTSLSIPSANPAEQATLTYTLAGSGINTTINNKPIAEVAKLYSDYARPTKQQPATGSAVPAAH